MSSEAAPEPYPLFPIPRLRSFLCACLLVATHALAAPDAEKVEFPALKEFEGRPVTLSAWLYRPEGSGPFPALVFLHGCSGQYDSSGRLTPSTIHWAELARREGYAALLVDSFGPRGQRSICAQQQRTITEARERVDDAYAALGWLAAQSFVAADRIGLIGWSNGGSGTLRSLHASRPDRGFRAAVAFYPGCTALSRAKVPYAPYAPLLVLIGEADDWTPAAPCVELAGIARKQGATMDIVTYPGASHGFDRVNVPVRYRPNVRNLSKPEGIGATTGEHPAARAEAERRALEFFARFLKN